MIRKALAAAAILLAFGSVPASASSITLTSTPVVGGAFDVVVRASDVFLGRDLSTDGLLSFGFDLVLNPAQVSFTGAISGALFDPISSVPNTRVFAAAGGFGIFPPIVEPLTLVTLHFQQLAAGPSIISLTTDLANPFHGLQFLNEPFADGISGRISVGQAAAVPEPATLLLLGSGVVVSSLRRRRRSESER